MEINEKLAKESLENCLDEREFFTTGYYKSIGILLFSLLSLISSVFFAYYSFFVYKAPVSYIVLNKDNKLLEEKSLTELHVSNNVIEQWANDSIMDIMSWNYLNFDKQGVKVNKYFFEEEAPKFMTVFNDLYLQKMIKANQGIVIPEVVNMFEVKKEVMWKGRKAVIINGDFLLKVYGFDGLKVFRYYAQIAIAREEFSQKESGLSIIRIDLNNKKVN